MVVNRRVFKGKKDRVWEGSVTCQGTPKIDLGTAQDDKFKLPERKVLIHW